MSPLPPLSPLPRAPRAPRALGPGLLAAFASLASILATPSGAQGASIAVALDGSGDFGDIQSALDAAGDGDTVLVSPGEYEIDAPIDFNRLHDPSNPSSPPRKNLTLRSVEGPARTVVRMDRRPKDPERASVMLFHKQEGKLSRVEGFTLTGGRGTRTTIAAEREGGGVSVVGGSSPTLIDCLITGNRADYGAGLYSFWSTPSLIRCTLAGNVARTSGGAATIHQYLVTFTSCILWDNVGGSLDLRDCGANVSYSCVQGGVPGIAPGIGSTSIDDDPLFCGHGIEGEIHVDASATLPGDGSADRPFRTLDGAIGRYSYALSAGSPCLGTGEGGANMGAEVGSCGGAATQGVRLRLAPGSYEMQGLSLVHAVSIEGVGPERTEILGSVTGLRTGSTLSGVSVTGGTEGGVDIGSEEAPSLKDCRISGNWDRAFSGVTCYGPAVFEGCTVSGNAGYWGAGIVVARASAGSASPGSVTPLFLGCTIAGNWSEGGYSGLSVSAGASPKLLNCVIAGNGSPYGFVQVGGASGTTADLVNCTLSGNLGEMSCGLQKPSLVNCILWGNSTRRTCGELRRCLQRPDPRFTDNGSFDFTRFAVRTIDGAEYLLPDFILREPDFRLRPDSPCIDAGETEGAPDVDIAGVPRPSWLGVDVGAREYAEEEAPSVRPQFSRADANADGLLNIGDPVLILRSLFSGEVISCLAAADADDDGVLNVTDPVVILRYLYMGGGPPADPFRTCGVDPTPDSLACASYPRCVDPP